VLDEILLFGSSGHAKSCVDLLESTKTFEIKGIVIREKSNLSKFMGYKIVGTDDSMEELISDCPYAVIGVGQIKDANPRIKLFEKLKGYGAELPIVISPHSRVSKHSVLKRGCMIFHHCVVNAGASVGANCIINNKSLVEHDVEISDHCHISTGSILNGGVIVEESTFIGSGSIIHEGVSIGKNSIIAAGSIVRSDLRENSVFKS
jgi:sugar O-acyltransferase (sialic acid O-acetyltransferase NeuD family)